MSNNHYTLGSDQHQAWMREYWYAPRGIGFTEPGIVSTDSAEFSAYNVAKSFYQNYPEVFNLKYISDKVGIPAAEVGERIKRMYDQHAIMFVYNPAVAVYGWGLYYWVVKLKDGTDPAVKAKLSEWFQNKDDICTGYETNGDFDYFNGNQIGRAHV